MTPDWTLGILAGGFSRRMGADKADLDVGGITLLEWVARRLAPAGTPVLVGTRPDGPGSRGPLPCCFDIVPGEGPLGSMAALLARCETSALVVVPCDLPLLPEDIGPRLCACRGENRAVAVEVEKRLQPFPALLERGAAKEVRELFEAGERRALAWLDRLPTARVPWSDLYRGVSAAEAFMNVNDTASYERFLSLVAEQA